MRTLLFLSIFFLFNRTMPAESKHPLESKIEMIADDYLNDPQARSISIGIIKGDQDYTYCFGNSCEGAPFTPASPYSVYEIGSITKVFTGILLAQETLSGRMNLQDPLDKYLKGISSSPYMNTITLHNLATHSSGMPRLASNFWNCVKDPGNPYAGYSENDLQAYLNAIKLDHPAGSAYSYSNVGMGLLGWIISKEINKDYERLVRERITSEISMDNTSSTLSPYQLKHLSTGFSKGKAVKNWDFQNCTSGQGSLRSNIEDMLKFARLNLQPPSTPLGKAVKLSQEEHFRDPRSGQRMGLGWHLGRFNGSKYLEHTGGTGGYRSFIGLIPESQIAVIVLSNSDIDVNETAIRVLKAVALDSHI